MLLAGTRFGFVRNNFFIVRDWFCTRIQSQSIIQIHIIISLNNYRWPKFSQLTRFILLSLSLILHVTLHDYITTWILLLLMYQQSMSPEPIASDRIGNQRQRCFAGRIYIFSMTDKICFILIASLVNIIKHYKVIFQIYNSPSFHFLPNFITFQQLISS